MDINGFANAVGSFEKAKVDKLTEPEKKTEKTLTEAVLPSKAEETAAAEYTPSGISEMVEYDKIKVEKMKAEADQRTEQLRQLVEKMLLKQGQKFTTLSEAIEDIRDGLVEVDPEVAAQAAEDIAEDGYWGVEQTSDRLVDFAKALAGNDTKYADAMIAALEKGYGAAEESWGDSLPEICQKTLEAAKQKLIDWRDGTSNYTTSCGTEEKQ